MAPDLPWKFSAEFNQVCLILREKRSYNNASEKQTIKVDFLIEGKVMFNEPVTGNTESRPW